MKRFISVVLALLMCLGLFSSMAMAEGEPPEPVPEKTTVAAVIDRISGTYSGTVSAQEGFDVLLTYSISSNEIIITELDQYKDEETGEDVEEKVKFTYNSEGCSQEIYENGVLNEENSVFSAETTINDVLKKEAGIYNIDEEYAEYLTNLSASGAGIIYSAGEYIQSRLFFGELFTDFNAQGKAQTLIIAGSYKLDRVPEDDAGGNFFERMFARISDGFAEIAARLEEMMQQIFDFFFGFLGKL